MYVCVFTSICCTHCRTMYLIKQRIRAHLFVNVTVYKYLLIIIILCYDYITNELDYSINLNNHQPYCTSPQQYQSSMNLCNLY